MELRKKVVSSPKHCSLLLESMAREEFAAFIPSEFERHGKIVKALGGRPSADRRTCKNRVK